MNIYIDFDDTITTSVENIVRIVNKRYGRKAKADDITRWDFSDIYPDIPREEIVSIFGEEEFFNSLHIKPYVLVSLHKLSKRNKVFIVSKVDNVAMMRKGEWIRKNINSLGIDVEFVGIPLTMSKGIIDMEGGIMIDDNSHFLDETNAKYKILFDNQRMKEVTDRWDGARFSDWKSLYKYLAEIIAKEKGIKNGKI